jgi:pentatricopeptide repeat protein
MIRCKICCCRFIRFEVFKHMTSIMHCTSTIPSFQRKINSKVRADAIATTTITTTTKSLIGSRYLHLTTRKCNSHFHHNNCTDRETNEIKKYGTNVITTSKYQKHHAATTATTTTTSSNILHRHSLSDPQKQQPEQEQQQYIMRMTIQWLHGKNDNTTIQWNRHDVAMAQNLIERWIQFSGNRNIGYATDSHSCTINTDTTTNTNEIAIRFLVIILKRWLYNRHPCVDHDTKELMHNLYRIISIIQQHTKEQQQQQHQVVSPSSSSLSINNDHTHVNNMYTNAYHLLQSVYMYSIQMNEPKLLPKPKAYSMILETFSNAILLKPKTTTNVTSHSTRTNHQTNNNNVEENTLVVMADQLMEQLDKTISASQPHYLQYQSEIIVAHNSYLQLLARYANSIQQQRIVEKAEYFLLHKMPQPNIKSYTAVIQGWVNINSPKRTMGLLDRMIQNGILPDQICYNICLYALGNGGYAKEAHGMLCNMIQIAKDTHDANMVPDAYSYLAVIKAYTKCNESNKAIELFEQMIQQQSQYQNGNRSNYNNHIVTIYTTILDALARQPNSGPNVELMLQYMEKLYEQTGIGQPCREAYTIAIRAWGQMTTTNLIAPDRATEIFRRMKNKSVQQEQKEHLPALGHRSYVAPCKISYTTLINAWAQSYRIDAPQNALQILRHMEQQQKYQIPNVLTVDICPDTITYNTVLNAFARHGLANEAHQLLNEMKLRMATDYDRKYSTMYPNVISYATVMQSYRNSSRHDVDVQANNLLLEIEELYDHTGIASLQPTPDLYSITILAQSTNIETAENIFWRMVDRYEKQHRTSSIDTNTVCTPNTYVCNALLRLWSKSDDPVAPQRAETILNWMEQLSPNETESSITPNYDSYKFVLHTWNKSKRRNAHQYIQKLQSKIKLYYPNLH